MTYSEVKELLSAGFTADEIRQMVFPQNPQNNPQPENTNIPENAQENSSEKESKDQLQDSGSAQDPGTKPAENTNIPEDSRFNQLNDTMQRILQAIQSSNRQNNSVDNIGHADLNSEVDRVMASIIRPEREGGNK